MGESSGRARDSLISSAYRPDRIVNLRGIPWATTSRRTGVALGLEMHWSTPVLVGNRTDSAAETTDASFRCVDPKTGVRWQAGRAVESPFRRQPRPSSCRGSCIPGGRKTDRTGGGAGVVPSGPTRMPGTGAMQVPTLMHPAGRDRCVWGRLTRRSEKHLVRPRRPALTVRGEVEGLHGSVNALQANAARPKSPVVRNILVTGGRASSDPISSGNFRPPSSEARSNVVVDDFRRGLPKSAWLPGDFVTADVSRPLERAVRDETFVFHGVFTTGYYRPRSVSSRAHDNIEGIRRPCSGLCHQNPVVYASSAATCRDLPGRAGGSARCRPTFTRSSKVQPR